MGAFEYYQTSFSYLDTETMQETFVGVPEEGGQRLISQDPMPPGGVYTAALTDSDTVALHRIEISRMSGSGRLRVTGNPDRAMKDSIITAFDYIKANKTRPGRYEFRHVKTAWLHSYRLLELGPRQQAFVAAPEKALLDLVYLEPGGETPAYLESLRLQNLDRLDLAALERMARESGSPKLQRAAAAIPDLAEREARDYEILSESAG